MAENERPWSWYCRICDAGGQAPTEHERDQLAFAHVNHDCRCSTKPSLATASAGHLRHVWRY